MEWFVRYIDDELKHEMVSRELATKDEALEEAWKCSSLYLILQTASFWRWPVCC
jgi:hypothetical protein